MEQHLSRSQTIELGGLAYRSGHFHFRAGRKKCEKFLTERLYLHEPKPTDTEGPVQEKLSLRTVTESMRSRRGSNPIPAAVGTVMVPWGLTVTSGLITSSRQ
jgi:hypothetical protein